MNGRTVHSHQVLEKDGKPVFVVVPYEEYLDLLSKAEQDVTIPHEVVEYVVDKDCSLVRAWREHLGLTQAEVAKRLGITQASLSQMERAGHNLRPATIRKLAAALGVHPEQLRE